MKLSVLLFFFFQLTISQNDSIKGIVYDGSDRLPIPALTVKNLSTNEKFITDFDGKYVIKAKIGDSLLFGFEGNMEKCYQKTRVLVRDFNPIDMYVESKHSMDYEKCETDKEFYALLLRRKSELVTHNEDTTCGISTGSTYECIFTVEATILGDYQNKTIKILGFPDYKLSKQNEILVLIEKRCDEYWLLNYEDVYKTKQNGLVIPYIFYNYRKFIGSQVVFNDVEFRNIPSYSKNNPNLTLALEKMPKDFYIIKNDRIIPTKGITLKDYSEAWLKKHKAEEEGQ